jgi:hypothetical protein
VLGLDLSIYAFVGIIMLVGIVKKNAIMMIDFAIEAERRDRTSARDAILQAASVRFRPIMMTTMAALRGTLPIALGHGAGAEARRPLGVAVVASAPLLQSTLARGLPPQLRDALPGLDTDAQRALAFVRALPVAAALVGMKRTAHLEENLRAAR